MSRATQRAPVGSFDQEVDAVIRPILRREPNVGSPIRSVRARLHELSSNWDSYTVTVTLEDGRDLRVFLKDFASRKRLVEDEIERRERELEAYRDILSSVQLDTPRFLGASWKGEIGRYWLFLEYVEGTPVKWLDFEHWVAVARWLGWKDAVFQEHSDVLVGRRWLIRPDAEFFGSVAARAERSASAVAPDLVSRLRPAIRKFVDLIPALVDRRHTLVHGTCRPPQILIDPSVDPARVCPLDWEKATYGPERTDLAAFCNGFDGARLDRLMDAYRESALRHGATIPERKELDRQVRIHWLFWALKYLVKLANREYKPDKLPGLAERFVARAEAESGGL